MSEVKANTPAEDAEIDDIELTTTKRHLCNKFQPVSVIHALQGKHKKLSFQESTSETKDPIKNCPIFKFTWFLKGYDIVGEHSDPSKQKAKTIAAQRFLKALFPKGYTWNQLQKHMMTFKEPLQYIIDL